MTPCSTQGSVQISQFPIYSNFSSLCQTSIYIIHKSFRRYDMKGEKKYKHFKHTAPNDPLYLSYLYTVLEFRYRSGLCIQAVQIFYNYTLYCTVHSIYSICTSLAEHLHIHLYQVCMLSSATMLLANNLGSFF